ncbi:hypothetical protein FB567DRAFT_626283 [Paraphoma chrysanthemicola]|uniref:Uncharacterized protein n=1 Tax=Paraphoma chrysanthemicola TaxID=798071 RepID=A0A8K0RDE1_9PLEO|nr:hypothetical protein FB567DRAFT_626283 [Paraphoma chrysanthemicola]
MAYSRYPHLEWYESSPGRWEREIDEAEQFYTYMAKLYEGTGRMAFAMTGFMSLSVQVSKDSVPQTTSRMIEDALRQAWLRLRFEHPTIASYVDYDVEQGKWLKSYTAFHRDSVDAQIEQWLDATFVLVDSRVSGIEWCNLDPLAPKLPTLFVISPASTQEESTEKIRRDLVIRSPHDIMDGLGTLQLLANLLKHASETFENPKSWSLTTPGSEYRNLSPPLRIAAGIPPILALEQQDRLQSIISRNILSRQSIETMALPFKRGPTIPGKHQRIAQEFSAPDTTHLLQACKNINATITHVYHAAVACALRDLQLRTQQSRQTRFISYALINERPKCTKPYSTPRHAASVYHSVSGANLVLDLTIPSINQQVESQSHQVFQAEFLTLVEQVQIFYHAIQNDKHHIALAPSFFSMLTPHILNPTSAPHQRPIPAPNDAPSVSISSLGVIDEIVTPRHGRFEVDNAWVAGEELGTGLGVFLGTWRGKLQVSAVWNEAWHDEGEVCEFLDACREVVWRGLGLGSVMAKGEE